MMDKELGAWRLLECSWDESTLKGAQNPRGVDTPWAGRLGLASCSSSGPLQGLLVPWGHQGSSSTHSSPNILASIRMLSQRLLLKLIHGERQSIWEKGNFKFSRAKPFFGLWGLTGAVSATQREEKCAWQKALAALGAMLQAQQAARVLMALRRTGGFRDEEEETLALVPDDAVR